MDKASNATRRGAKKCFKSTGGLVFASLMAMIFSSRNALATVMIVNHLAKKLILVIASQARGACGPWLILRFEP